MESVYKLRFKARCGNGEYKPSPKHKGPKMPPNASPDPIPDIKTGNDLLKKIILIIRRPKNRGLLYIKGK